MLIQGSAVSGRTDYIVKAYINLLNKGVDASKILVLCLNSYKKNIFFNKVKENTQISHYENIGIFSFNGLVYNTVNTYWPLIENTINIGKPVITPNLTGLEISQIFFKYAIDKADFKDYNSKINLLHQLFRRYSLITHNCLSDEEVLMRSEILGEKFAPDAKKAIDFYKKKTVEYRAFDYIRQLGLFEYLYKNTKCLEDIEYLIIDDADEITPFEFEFIKTIKPHIKESYIAYDRNGSSRLGFLSTDTQIVNNLETLFFNDKKIELDNIGYEKPDVKLNYLSRRLEMVNEALQKIISLINSGVNPEDICIVTPIIDKSLKFAISEAFDSKNIDYQYFSGSEKLSSVPAVRNVLNILDIAINSSADEFKIRSVICDMLKIPLKHCIKFIETLKNGEFNIEIDFGIDEYNNIFKRFKDVLSKIKSEEMLLSQKIMFIYDNLFYPESHELNQIAALKFFLKQIEDFETVFYEDNKNLSFQKSFLTQLENSIISENPSSAPELKKNAIIIGTAQKIIDYSISSKYQIWLDISSNEWVKDDMGMLYNAWVFQKSWKKCDFNYEDNLALTSLKTQKQLRKLSLLSTKEILAYASLFDAEGNENFDGIENYVQQDTKNDSSEINFNFIPREDQKPVLKYKEGLLSVSAVPGAGKTTILLALIIKLIQSGVKCENIFVLTYMDSAARNFKERIKNACPSLDKMPNISTIHGLALRILKENSNYTAAGLNEDFEVCDDNLRQKIIREIMYKMQIDQDDYDKYERALSVFKLSDNTHTPFVKDVEIKKFLKFSELYNQYLRNINTIDYDDMLCCCVNVLDKNKDIAQYYQSLCHYIIEDEAQDSSSIQQKLLSILSEKHKNLVRCGDVNQAITTTFTNADLEGFRTFMKHSQNVTMNHSQRCAKDIYELANKLIDFSYSVNDLNTSFFNIKMKPVNGKNPNVNESLFVSVFDDYTQEQSFILENIRKIFAKNPEASVALLVRNNYHIEDYAAFLSNYGYSVITKNDTLDSQPVFSLIYAILKFSIHPWRNETVLNIYKILTNQKIIEFQKSDEDFIKNLSSPFVMLSEADLNSRILIQILWDLNYWLQLSTLDIDEFAIKTGCYYFSSDVEKSNIYLVSLLLKRLSLQYKDRRNLLERLEELSKKPVRGRYNFFTEEDKETPFQKGKIQIMTYHKAKGDEFDYVFIPQLSEDILPLNLENIKIKSKERFLESVKALKSNYKRKDEYQLKRFIAEENMRLLYVAVTRAKQKIYITCAKKYKRYSKLKEVKPSVIFEKILNNSGATFHDK